MKKLRFLAILFLIFNLNAFALSENKEYEKLKTPLSNEQNSLMEVFSFKCIHCYNHHKMGTLAKTKEKLPQLTYEIYPLTNITFGAEFANLYAYASAKDKANSLDSTALNSLAHKLMDAYFVAFFERKTQWQSSQDFYALGFKVLGINANELNLFLQSSEAKELLDKYAKAQSVVMQYGGTPSFSVNGKYLLLMKDIKSLDDFINTVNELSKL